jgi:hypothetical protein
VDPSVREPPADSAIEVGALGRGTQQGFMHVGGHVEVSIAGVIAKLDLKKFAVSVIRNGRQGGRFHDGGFHGYGLSFDICGFRLRLRSPSAAAISFQRAIVFWSPTAGEIASITR